MPVSGPPLEPVSNDHPSAPIGAAAADAPARQTIGALLRQTRLSCGGEIDRIAATLRIRASYLAAIEDGQYDRLPGAVYAMGFVRAYAVHLGLDGDEAVRRFRRESAGLEVPRDLSFPMPLTERSVPGGTMLLAAVILAICGYGVWYYVSTGERERPERVSAVPPELTVPPPASAPVVAPGPAPEPAPPPQQAAAPAPQTVPPPAVAAAPAPEPASPPEQAAAPAPQAPSPPAAAETPPAATAGPPASAAAPASPSAAPAATAATASPPVTGEPRTFGAIGAPSRITIIAAKDSWVLISDGGRTILERILHAGDTVRVPDRAGLMTSTGNGSGLEIDVDGAKAPALGGTIHRGVALDPAKLMAGDAIASAPNPAPVVPAAPATPSAAAPVGASPPPF